MAACPIIDFGSMQTSRERADKPSETDPQKAQNQAANYSLLGQMVEPRERYKTEQASVEGAQREAKTRWPFSVTLVESQLESLPQSEDIEVRPTIYAHKEAKRLIVGAYVSIFSDRQHTRKLPRPIIGTDDGGGILVSWTLGNKYVAAKFAPQPGSRSFVYFEEGAQHQAQDLTEQNLLNRLQWL